MLTLNHHPNHHSRNEAQTASTSPTPEELKDFITIEELESVYQGFNSVEERDRAESTIHYASQYLRLIGRNNGVDIDAKIREDTTGVYGDAVKMVISNAVKRTLAIPSDAPDATSWSQTATPYSESFHYAEGSISVYFKAKELDLLGLGSVSGKSKIAILRGVR